MLAMMVVHFTPRLIVRWRATTYPIASPRRVAEGYKDSSSYTLTMGSCCEKLGCSEVLKDLKAKV